MRRRPASGRTQAHEAPNGPRLPRPGTLFAGTPRRPEDGVNHTLLWNMVLRESEQVMSVNDTAACLGARVRELRQDRGLTLKALGRRAGLSHPFLSQVERGIARPSVGSVERIASALEVPVSALWAERRAEGARVVRADEGAVGGGRELPVGGAMRVREWSGGGRSWPDEAETVVGEVLVYVVRAEI